MWRMMIRALFEKSGSLDSNQKHRSTSENNLSSLVSGLYSARSRGTRAKYLSLFHKSIFLSAYCSTQDVGDLFQFEGPVFLPLVSNLMLLKWERRKKGRGIFGSKFGRAWEKPAGTFAIPPTPRLMTSAGFALACIPAQLLLPWRIKQLFPSMPLDTFTYFSPADEGLFISWSLTGKSSVCASSHSTRYQTDLLSMTSPASPGHIWCFQACFCAFLPPWGLD